MHVLYLDQAYNALFTLHMAKSCPLLRTQCRQHLLREVFFVLTPSSTRRVMNLFLMPQQYVAFLLC